MSIMFPSLNHGAKLQTAPIPQSSAIRFEQESALLTYDLISCPACGGDLYRSRRQGIVERYILAVLQIRAYRCHRCRSRFLCLPTLLFRTRDVEPEDERKKRKRKSAEAHAASEAATAAAEKGAPTPR
jgi:transposase-like protein